MAYTPRSKTTSLGSNGEQGSSISAEDIRRIWEGIKWGTKIASEYLYQVSDDYRKFAPINEAGKVRRKTRLFTKASEFFNKKIGE